MFSYNYNKLNPLNVIIWRKKYWLDNFQDTKLRIMKFKKNNIYFKYNKKLFKGFESYKFFKLWIRIQIRCWNKTKNIFMKDLTAEFMFIDIENSLF